MTYDYTFKVVLIGDKGTGKSTLTQRFLTNLFKSKSRLTIGVDFEVKSLEINGKKIKLQIWDFGGQDRFRFLLSTYVRNAEGGIFMYDITNYSSLARLDDWLMAIRKEFRAGGQFPILIVGNKADLEDNREVSREEGIQFAKVRGVDGFIECSAKTGENVEEMFDALTRLMIMKNADKKKNRVEKKQKDERKINEDEIKNLKRIIRQKDDKIEQLKISLITKEKLIRSKMNQIQIIENSVKIKEKKNEVLREEIKQKNKQIRKLKDLLEIKEKIVR